MARLSAPFALTGSFGGLVAYQRKDFPSCRGAPLPLTDQFLLLSVQVFSEGAGSATAAQ